jgi:hypothetical protein
LLDCEYFTPGLVPLAAPAFDVFFQPEEQHSLSSKFDIIPPVFGRS